MIWQQHILHISLSKNIFLLAKGARGSAKIMRQKATDLASNDNTSSPVTQSEGENFEEEKNRLVKLVNNICAPKALKIHVNPGMGM